jgi:hypothetical protein
VFHEQDAYRIKRSVEYVGKNICAIKFNTIHFYGDYDHVLNGCGAWKDLYENKIYMIRNGLGIHHGSIGGDSDAHVLNDCSPIPQPRTVHMLITMYHYGHVRSAERYERKQNLIERRHCVNGPSSYIDVNVNMIDKSVLSKFAGTHPAVMGGRVSVGTSDHAKIVDLYV